MSAWWWGSTVVNEATGNPGNIPVIISLAPAQGAPRVLTVYFSHARGNSMELENREYEGQKDLHTDNSSMTAVKEVASTTDSTQDVMEVIEISNSAPDTNNLPENLNQMNNQSKKLSGCQIRRLRRAEKIALGTWTKENPHKTTCKTGIQKYIYVCPCLAILVFKEAHLASLHLAN